MKRILASAFVAALLCGGAGLSAFAWIRHAATAAPVPDVSVEVVDREGRLLRPFALDDGRWRLAADVGQIDRRFVAMLTTYEDRRFREHVGVDPLALGRAALQLVSAGRIVSGGSTLTMQVARLMEPRTERTFFVKLAEIRRALALEARLTKDEILSLYLTLAPYGGNLEGVRAAALTYFGKEPKKLTLGEAALLVALPQSPEARRPDRAGDNARRARDRVLERMLAAGVINSAEAERARLENVPVARRAMPLFAPHAAEAAIAARPALTRHRLAIDRPLQERLEDLVRERAATLGQELSIAVVAVDTASGDVIARIGSSDFYDAARAGQVDMTRAVRSPGSTLKPFIYGIAFEDGVAHPETLMEDRPTRFGGYAPENFDLQFQGTVTARRALQLSLNVPAVALLDAVGPQRLASRLAGAGARFELPQGEVPGLAIGLGGVGVRLEDLALLYSSLARLGEAKPLTVRLDEAPPARRARLMEPVAAWYVGQALLGTPPPESAVGGRIAFKTGTSYGYRDAWAVGFDGKRTIAVWVGRPDGRSVPGLIGRAAAAPVLFDAFARAAAKPTPLPPAPPGALIASNLRLPTPLRRFSPPAARANMNGEAGLRIVFPPDGAKLAREGEDQIVVKTSGGAGPFTLLVDGLPAGAGARTIPWRPAGPGFARLTVIDANGAADSVFVRLQ
jgi:penicillin-binding protein 1C